MDAAQRTRIRHAIDARRRELVRQADEPTCARCGAEQSHRTTGCRACSDRHTKINRRLDPVYRAHEVNARRERRRNGSTKRKVPSEDCATVKT